MFESFDYARLNRDTKKYLADVKRSGGRGLPGVYTAVGDKRPIWAFLAGAVILPLFLWIGYTSSKAPWATAMLQTAGVLLGGWLMAFAVRRWLAGTDGFAGYFYYFDPLHAFIGEGETLRVGRVLPSAQVTPRGAQGLTISTELDESTIGVPNRLFAERVADFYHALVWVRAREEGPWADLEDDEAGAVARYLAEEDETPQNLAEADLRIDSMTDDVGAVGRSKTGLLGLLVWVAVGAGAYGIFSTTNGMIQDNMAFADARDNLGKSSVENITGAQGLRDYLLNERNTRNRDDAARMLSKLYDAPIGRVKSNPNAAPELQEGMAALLDSLRGPETPAVSIEVIDTTQPASTPISKGLRSRFADGIATTIGKDLIAFGEAPSGKPALMTIRYGQSRVGSVAWTVEIRLKPDDATIYRASGETPFFAANFQPPPYDFGPTPELPASATDAITEAVYADVMAKMIGQAPAKPAAITGEDW